MQIGDILRGLMARDGLTLEAVAEGVRRAGAPTVRYQHIQQLLDIPTRKPRYLVELARSFGMSVEQFLQWSPNAVNETRPEYLSNRASQSVGLSPSILASAYQLVRLAHVAMDLAFNAEDPEDAALVLLACAYLQQRNAQSVTPDNLVDFTGYLRKHRSGDRHDVETEPGARSARSGTRG